MENSLSHYGIKGQKYGERRYQNEDGSYTEEGKARRRIGISDEVKNKFKNVFEPSIKGGKDKPPQSPAEKIIKTTESTISDANNLANAISDIRFRNSGSKASHMSDDELRKAINRLQMEQQYSNLTRSTGKGMQIVKDILSIAGPVVAIAGGAATVASSIYSMKNKKGE